MSDQSPAGPSRQLPGLGVRRSATASARVRGWATDILGDDRSVMVTELACSEPGCPPLETVIGMLIAGDQRQYKIHKPLDEVTADDVRLAVPDPSTT